MLILYDIRDKNFMKFLPRISLYSIVLILAFGNVIAAPAKNKQTAKDKQTGYIQVTGGKLYYEQYGSKNSNPVIVLHGGPGVLDSSYLLPQMAELAKENEVVFYDQRGSGKSLEFTLDNESINIESFINDLDAVRAKFGYNKFTLVGHSWGGLLAMAYAIKYPQYLNALVLTSSAPSDTAGFQVFAGEYVKRAQSIQPELAVIESSTKFVQGDPATVRQYFKDVFAIYFYKKEQVQDLTLVFTKEGVLSGRKVADLLMHNYLSNYDLTTQLKTLQLPVLLIHGENDIVPLSTAQATQAAIPESQLVVLKDCDHFPYIEQPGAFFNDMQAFINAHKDE